MPTIVTPLYAAILALIYIWLSIRVIAIRRRLWISIGDKGNADLMRQSRVHGNFSEYVPLCLVLMLCAELLLAPIWLAHALGVILVVARALHAIGVGRKPESLTLRTFGMLLTFFVLIAGALTNLVYMYLMSNFAG